MSDLLSSYSSDLSTLVTSVRSKISSLPAGGEPRKASLRRLDMELEECGEILSQMELEISSFPQSVRSRFLVELRGQKSEVEALKRDVKAAFNASAGGGGYNVALEESGGGDLESQGSREQRERLLQGTATLEDGTRRLEESHRLALETEDLGADILRDLRGQREQIEHSRDTLRQADANIDRSSKTLSKMIRRAKQQKLVTIGIVVVLVLLILLILYSKL
ncbi:t-SNARE VTI1 [Thecaphora frezii]